jgi:hypothetical protein
MRGEGGGGGRRGFTRLLTHIYSVIQMISRVSSHQSERVTLSSPNFKEDIIRGMLTIRT